MLCYPFPFERAAMVGSLVLPRQLTRQDKARLVAFIRCLPTRHICKIYDCGLGTHAPHSGDPTISMRSPE